MAEPREYRIFISSPSDVWAERERLFRIVTRLSGEFGSVRLTPFRWEESYYSATQTFQEQIPPPSQSDLVICVFWKRLGSELPPQYRRPDGSLPTGSEFEFEDAIKAAREHGAPDVLVYRKTAAVLFDAERITLEAAQYAALQTFWQRWFQNATGHFTAGYHSFATTDEFEMQVEAHLRQWLARQQTVGKPGVAWPVETKGSPFKGLEPFDEGHAAVFFGRRRVVELLRERLIDAAGRGAPFLLLLGMSGSGKSSLVRAGLAPRLAQPGAVTDVDLWRRCTIRPSEAEQSPLIGLARALYRSDVLPELAAGDSATPEELTALLRSAPEAGAKAVTRALQRCAQAVATREGFARPLQARLMLVIDQLEELFALPEPAIGEFVTVLLSLVASGSVWVLTTMRSDFYATLQAIPGMLALKEKGVTFDLLPPSAAEIEDIIVGPASAAGLRYERRPGGEPLNEELAQAALTPGSLPFLQFTLDELFKARDETTNTLTIAAYDRLGGLAGAIERRAEATFAALDPESQAELAAVIRELVTISRDDVATARAAGRDKLTNPAARARLVDAFLAARLLVASTVGDRVFIRIAHESLVRSWPRVQELIAADRDFLRTRMRVESAAQQWEDEKRDPDFLLSAGRPLAEAAEILKERPEGLSESVVAFVEASIAADAARQDAERSRREARLRSEADAALRLTRRTRIAALVVLVLFLIAVGDAYFAVHQRSVAQHEAEQAGKNFAAALATATKLVNEVRANFAARSISARMAGDILATTEGTLGQLSALNSTPEVTHQQIGLLLTFSDTLRALGASRKSLARAEDAEHLARELVVAQPDHTEYQRDLAAALESHGDSLSVLGNMAAALEEYRAELALMEKLVKKDPANADWQAALSLSHRKIAEDLRDRGQTVEAMAEFRASLAIAGALAAADPDNVARQGAVAILDDRIGDMLRQQEDIDGALAQYRAGLVILERLAKREPDNLHWRRNIGVVHEKMGYVLAAKNDKAQSLDEFRTFLRAMEQIAASDPSNAATQRDISDGHDDVGDALIKLGDFKGAEAEYRGGLAIRERLVAKDVDNVRWQRDLALSHAKLGDLALARDETDSALKEYQASLTVSAALSSKDADNASLRDSVATAHEKLGAAFVKRSDVAKALAEYEAARDILESLVAAAPSDVARLKHLQIARAQIAALQAQSASTGSGKP